MEKLFKLLLINLSYALEATASESEVAFMEEAPKEEAPKEEAPKEDAPLPNPNRKKYTQDAPAKTKAEKELFKIQWQKLNSEMQERYHAGQIDSTGEEIASAEVDEDFGDFGEAQEAPKPEHTAEEMREALKAYARENGKEEAYKVLAQFGAKKIADIKEAQFSEVMAEIS